MHRREAIFLIRNLLLVGGDRRALELEKLLEADGYIVDTIGLHDGGLAPICDVTVAVTAPVEDRIARLVAREGISAEYAKKRIDAQHSDDWFREKSDVTLENNGSLAEFEAKCVAFLADIRYNK